VGIAEELCGSLRGVEGAARLKAIRDFSNLNAMRFWIYVTCVALAGLSLAAAALARTDSGQPQQVSAAPSGVTIERVSPLPGLVAPDIAFAILVILRAPASSSSAAIGDGASFTASFVPSDSGRAPIALSVGKSALSPGFKGRRGFYVGLRGPDDRVIPDGVYRLRVCLSAAGSGGPTSVNPDCRVVPSVTRVTSFIPRAPELW